MMETEMAENDLPSDYLSPRSKVARMLADIDDGPTPSPSPARQSSVSNAQHNASRIQISPTQSRSDDEDGSPTRPIGRAARRMLNAGSEDERPVNLQKLRRGTHRTPTRSSPPKQRTPAQLPASSTWSNGSPGLFVSPARSLSAASSDDDLPDNPLNGRPLPTPKAVTPRDNAASDLPDEILELDEAEPELDKILSDAARPTRKASKKAMLEMERETQRLAREQALAHEMRTKKKFTPADLFARMKFRQPVSQQSSSPAQNSDGVEVALPQEPVSTPPSSPPTPWDTQKAIVERGALAKMIPIRQDSMAGLQELSDDDELPEVQDILKQSQAAKASAKQMILGSPSARRISPVSRVRSTIRRLRIQPEESDDELDIVAPMPAHLSVFDRVKPVSKRGEVHSKAIHALKHLAHLNHDTATARGKKALKPVVPYTAINAQLIATAKAQARQAQQQRLAELQAKGVVILSTEEQEREHDQFENLLDKARQEAEDIRKQEKAARRKAGGEDNAVASEDEDEDADWQDSEEEEDGDEGDGDEEDEGNDLVDDIAEDSAPEDDTVPTEGELHNTTDEPSQTITTAKPRKPRIIVDEDDEEEVEPTTDPVSDDPFAAFGFDAASGGPSLMSPTQAFAATMQTPSQFTQAVSSMAYDERPPPPTFGQLPSQFDQEESQLVPASQQQEHTQVVNLEWDSQLPETPVAASNTMMETPGWEPSQDAGLPSPWTAARGRLFTAAGDAHETQSTVALRISESPDPAPRRGRLTKGIRVVDSDYDEPVTKKKNAFAEMQRLRMKTMNATERAAADKEMKSMMDDQAEESEDEYAGLGGDDSNMIAPETEEDRAMFDETNIEVDEKQEREMQRFYAERQRAAEEEATSKLYKDLTTGALRRRQGVGWELDEDEDELAARRRQIKQREEARKRRLLLQDDNVKGLLEGKGSSKGREAFLRTIGDDDDNNEDDLAEIAEPEPSQQESQTAQIEALREISNNKRTLEHTQDDQPAAKMRRTRIEDGAFSRPSSMLQVRESLSFLLDEPEHAVYGPTNFEDEDDAPIDEEDPVAEEMARDNDGGVVELSEMPPPPLPTDRLPASQRRTTAKPEVIDRLSLRRSSSSASSTGGSAWSTGSGAVSKVPSLLRRATSNLSTTSSKNERGVSYNNTNANDRGVSIGGARTGGSKKSSLAYQSRAQERRAQVERADKKREDSRLKLAELRRRQGGALVSGGFESGQWEM